MAKTLTILGTTTAESTRGQMTFAVQTKADQAVEEGVEIIGSLYGFLLTRTSGEHGHLTIDLIDKNDVVVESVSVPGRRASASAFMKLDIAAGAAASLSDDGQIAVYRVDATEFSTGKIRFNYQGTSNGGGASTVQSGDEQNLNSVSAYKANLNSSGTYEAEISFTVSGA